MPKVGLSSVSRARIRWFFLGGLRRVDGWLDFSVITPGVSNITLLSFYILSVTILCTLEKDHVYSGLSPAIARWLECKPWIGIAREIERQGGKGKKKLLHRGRIRFRPRTATNASSMACPELKGSGSCRQPATWRERVLLEYSVQRTGYNPGCSKGTLVGHLVGLVTPESILGAPVFTVVLSNHMNCRRACRVVYRVIRKSISSLSLLPPNPWLVFPRLWGHDGK